MSARLLTASGVGGVAVIEVLGEDGRKRLGELCGRLPEPGRLRLVRPLYRDEVLDEALLVARTAEAFELHVHASPPLVEELLELFGPTPAGGPAPRQRRSRLAALHDALAQASSEEAARILLDQVEGAWEGELERLAALTADERDARLTELVQRGRTAMLLWHPPRIVLAGPVNAGKSTLFNALVARARVLVSDEPGTTRDAVHERTHLGAWPVELIDTAGERAHPPGRAGAVEAAGQERARDLALRADLVLRLAAADGPTPEPVPAHGRVIGLLSRCDLVREPVVPAGWTPISAGTDPHATRERVARCVRERWGLPEAPWTPGAAVPVGEEALELCERLLGERRPTRVRRLLALLRQGRRSAFPSRASKRYPRRDPHSPR